MNGTHSAAAIRPTSGNHQRLLDDEPLTRRPRSRVERAGAWTVKSSDNVDWPDPRCARNVGEVFIWNNLIPAVIVLNSLAKGAAPTVFSVSRHSPNELWNGVDNSGRRGFPKVTGGTRSAPGVFRRAQRTKRRLIRLFG